MKLTHEVTVFKRFIYLFTTVLLLATSFVLPAQDSTFSYPYRHSLIAERQFVPSLKDYGSPRYGNYTSYAYNANCFRISYQYLISWANYRHRNTGVTIGAGVLYREGQMTFGNVGYGLEWTTGTFTHSRWYTGFMFYTEWQTLSNLRLATGLDLGGLLHTSGRFIRVEKYIPYNNAPYNTWIWTEEKVDERSYFRTFNLDLYADVGFRFKLYKNTFLLPGCRGYIERRDLNIGNLGMNLSGSFYLGLAF